MAYCKVVDGYLLRARTMKEMHTLEKLTGFVDIDRYLPDEHVETFELEEHVLPQGLYSDTRNSFNAQEELYNLLMERFEALEFDLTDLIERKKE